MSRDRQNQLDALFYHITWITEGEKQESRLRELENILKIKSLNLTPDECLYLRELMNTLQGQGKHIHNKP